MEEKKENCRSFSCPFCTLQTLLRSRLCFQLLFRANDPQNSDHADNRQKAIIINRVSGKTTRPFHALTRPRIV